MTQYNSLNVKLSNSQLNKLKSTIKNETDVVLRLSSNMVGNSGDNTDFPHELLLTNRQVANIRKAFANRLSTDIKFSKAQLSKMIQSGGFLGKLLGPLLKTGLPLIKRVIKNEAKEQRGGFLSMLLGTLGASLLGDILSKGLSGKGVIRAGEGTIRAGEGSKRSSLKIF